MMDKSLLFLGVFVCLVAMSTQVEETPAEDNAVKEEVATEKPPKTTPVSEWGSYYATDKVNMDAAFKEAFAAFKRKDEKASKCSQSEVANSYSRYYKNIKEAKSTEYILSYYCQKGRGYEHLRVNIADVTRKDTAKFVKFYKSLTELGITGAGDYEDVNNLSGEDARDKAQDLFEQNREQLSEHLPGACKDPTLNTEFTLQTKEENALTYFKFPVACTMTIPNDYFTDIEVFQDKTNYFINDGALTFVGAGPLVDNQNYHIKKQEDLESGKMTDSAVPVLLSLPLLVLSRFLF